jgi:hypothetical protein
MLLRRTKNRSLPDLASADALDLNWHLIKLIICWIRACQLASDGICQLMETVMCQ